MSQIYKSAEGERLIRERYLAFLTRWPVGNQQIRVPTSQGETFVVACGPPQAPPLLLLHGGAANSSVWMGDITAYASNFRAYCVDLIGEPGLSAPSRPSLASDVHAVWLDEVLQALGVTRTSVFGASLGGWLALDYATRHPEKVERLAVMCPGGVGRQKLGIVFATLAASLCGSWGKRKLMERILGRPPADPPPPVKAFIDFMALIHAHFRPRMVKLPRFSDERLRNLTMPLLAIVGARDVLLDSAETKRRLERHAPNGEVIYFQDAGHFIPGQTGRIVAFLSQTDRAESGANGPLH